jgi:hypothetical protein
MVQEMRVSEEQSEREGEKLLSILHPWDATSLITCVKFQLELTFRTLSPGVRMVFLKECP